MTAEEAVSAAVAEHAARLAARAEEVALCLDFDGTLSPIVPDPEAARPLEGMVELLGPLAAFAAATQLATDGGEALRVAVRSDEAPQRLLAEADLVVEGPSGLREFLERLAQDRT